MVTGEETGRAFRCDRDDQGDIRPWKTSAGQREQSLTGVREAGAFVFTLDRVMSRELEGVYYWPSFEIVRWCGAHLPWRSYGLDDRNPRHVSRYLVAEIIDAFVESFYTPAAAAELSGRRGREVPPPWSLAGRLRAASSQQAIRRLRSLPARAGARARLALHL